MEFEDLKKIWDTQNNEPMYAINETALHKRIHHLSRRTGWLAHVNEIGIIIIALFTSAFLLFDALNANESPYAYVGPVAFVLIGLFVYLSRHNRKKNENSFDQSMLGELNSAIRNATYLVRFARTFVWWFLLPAAAFCFPNMWINNDPWYKWLLVLASFWLSYLVVSWDLNRVHLPRKRQLEALQAKLTEVGDEEG